MAEERGSVRGRGLMRLRGLVRKEFLQVVRDPSSIAIAFLLPLVLLILFGYGVSLDAKDVPVAIVVENPSPAAISFTSHFRGSRYFSPVHYENMREGREALLGRKVAGIIYLRSDFARRLKDGGPAEIQVIVNGVESNYARLVEGYAQGVWLQCQSDLAQQSGRAPNMPLNLEQRIWYNSEVRSRDFLVPGLIAVIMTLIGALLTAMVMAREWERGTMEALLVTPVRMWELLLGKLITYFTLGTGGLLMSVAIAVWWFGVPLRGSFWVLFASSSLFLLVALAMGLLISIAARNQFVAGQTAIIVTYLPAFLLSGYIFNIRSMPWVIRLVTRLVAARYFVAILQTVFLAGNVWSVILPNTAALVAMTVIFFALVSARSRKSLE